METLAEFLKSDKSQAVVLRRIVGMFRESGEWGKRGLYARIGSTMGLSPAYVGRVLTGKQSITDTFLEKMAVYFGVSVPWLRGAPVGPLERFLEGLKLAGIDSKAFNQKIAIAKGVESDYWRELVTGSVLQNCSTIPAAMCSLFGINSDWVQSGYYPRRPELGIFPLDAPIAPNPAVRGLTEGLEIQSEKHKEDLSSKPRSRPAMFIGNISKDELQRIMEIITGDVKANNPDSTDHEILEAVKHSKQAIIDEVQKALKKAQKEKPDSE